jgi:hypothetical protein
MSANEALSKATLKDFIQSEESILKEVELREHIFEIQLLDEAPMGFISLYDLKTLSQSELEECKIRNIDSEDFVLVYSHPFFQRRKPQLISTESLAEEFEQFYLLKAGQKTGPFEKHEILSMIEDKEILMTDMVSLNAGHSWIKIFHIENFDRRTLKENEQLPGIPTSIISAQNDNIVPMTPETEALSGLAYLSNVKRGKVVEKQRFDTFEQESKSGKDINSKTIYKFILALSIIGIAYFLYNIKNHLSAPFSDNQKTIGEQAEMLTPVENVDPSTNYRAPSTNPSAINPYGERKSPNQINDQQRTNGKFTSPRFEPVRPTQRKSFMESGKYQEVNRAPGEEDPNYFYDNSSAMELDPVRSQVSRENFDNSQNEAGPIPSSDNLFDSEVSN